MNPDTAGLLAQLRDIHLPAQPSWWPPAPGWWALALLTAILMGYIAYLLAVQARRITLSANALDLLDNISDPKDQSEVPGFLADLNVLMRRIAVLRYSRSRVSSLTGEQWLDFLDRTLGSRDFSRGIGRIFVDGPYRKVAEADVAHIRALVERWVKKNTGAHR